MSEIKTYWFTFVQILSWIVGCAGFATLILTRHSFGARHFTEHSFYRDLTPHLDIVKRWGWPLMSTLYTGGYYLFQKWFERNNSEILFLFIGLTVFLMGYSVLIIWEFSNKSTMPHTKSLGQNILLTVLLKSKTPDQITGFSNLIEIPLWTVLSVFLWQSGYNTASVYFGIGAFSLWVKVISKREAKLQKDVSINDAQITDAKTLEVTTPEHAGRTPESKKKKQTHTARRI